MMLLSITTRKVMLMRVPLSSFAAPWILLAVFGLGGCGGDAMPQDTPRAVTGSTSLTGLWRVISNIGVSTQRTAVTVVDNGSTLTMNDCGLAYRNYALSRSGNQLSGYYFNLAPILVTNNDTMTYNYSTIDRDFAKMDRDPLYDMGSFSISSPAFSTINASSDVCVGFSDSGAEESLIMATRINGQMVRIAISLTNSLRLGSFAIEPFGNAPATVTLDGEGLQTLIGADSSSVLQGTLKITRRGTVWVEGTVSGLLDDAVTDVAISFRAEMP